MKKYAISILCNNVQFLDTIIKNIQTLHNDVDFYIFTDTRIGDKTEQLKPLCDLIHAKLITDKQVNKKLKKEVVDTPFVDSFSMSLNILMHWYMFKYFKHETVLFCDDDVIIKPEILSLLEQNKTCIFAFPLNTIRDSADNPKRINTDMAACFNYKIDYTLWKKYYTVGAYIIYTRKDFNIDLYEKGLHNFFSSTYFDKIWSQRRSFRVKNLDERFMTMFILKSKIGNTYLNKYAKHIVAKFDKINDSMLVNAFKKKYIIHIGNGDNKGKTYNRCKELGLIKCKKFK